MERAAVYATMDSIAERISSLLVARGSTPTTARVTARTYIFAVYFGVLEQWHHDGRTRPIGDYTRAAPAVVRRG